MVFSCSANIDFNNFSKKIALPLQRDTGLKNYNLVWIFRFMLLP